MLKSKITTFLLVFLLAPVLVLVGAFFLEGKQYYITAILIAIMAFVPFFLNLKKKKLGARERVIMASVSAIAVASRVVFFQIPQVKPMCAILIISAVVFGKEIGFALGALSMLLSNLFFGQGAFTPFQMLGMAMAVYVSAFICENKKVRKSNLLISVAGGISCFIVYGLIVDFGSVVLMTKDFSIGSIISIYSSGIVYNLIHGITTFLILLIGYKPISEKLERVKIKYELFGEGEN